MLFVCRVSRGSETFETLFLSSASVPSFAKFLWGEDCHCVVLQLLTSPALGHQTDFLKFDVPATYHYNRAKWSMLFSRKDTQDSYFPFSASLRVLFQFCFVLYKSAKYVVSFIVSSFSCFLSFSLFGFCCSEISHLFLFCNFGLLLGTWSLHRCKNLICIDQKKTDESGVITENLTEPNYSTIRGSI